MGNRPDDRKRRQDFEQFLEDSGGGLFQDDIDVDKYTIEEDPIYQMRKYPIHFRMMALLPEFKWIQPDMVVSFGQPGDLRYDEGRIDENGQIYIPARDITVPTLTAFATEVIPDSWYKLEKSGSKGKSRPDGWNRTWITYHNGGHERAENILFRHHRDLKYTVEELSRLDYIYEEMIRRGFQDQISDLMTDLKAWNTAQEKQSSSAKTKQLDQDSGNTGAVGETGTLF